ncbi:DUF3472 domain-containing protein [Massilia phyllosphaerae]|uniref:DUF3472 domain-containing protein n=1 Tax=Massilia phyllosphaerae TaxID=3106034 RepID=UPI002B1CDF18|nr:DUF3472 domain-containing protein [Massilia sp. SGZ-792]
MEHRIMLLKAAAFAATMAAAPLLAHAADAVVALAGNAFITSAAPNAAEVITSNGLGNWTSASTVTSTYFRVAASPNCSRSCPASVTVSLNARLAGSNNSTVRVSVNGVPFDVKLSGNVNKNYAVGTLIVPAGYVKVDLQGVSKDGGYFGDVSSIGVSTNATLNYANDPANYYWSRRGPSVHLGFTVPAQTEYFYNEVTVPQGQDKIGSYFMANGFNGGYFGMQVKSASERWMLFSVWDADNGARTTLVGKGGGVVDNGFGGEGTGGQSYLSFPWVAGNTYRFITRAHADGAGGTDYSAWFFAPETGVWKYIATWKRPATTNSYLTGVYSFLENFIDTNGYMERSADYGNQWARTAASNWTEITSARFTGDATAANAQRMDYAGGLRNSRFYLRNGGFFSNYVTINQNFTRPATGTAPSVDLNALPLQ